MIARFFGGDTKVYAQIGELSAEFFSKQVDCPIPHLYFELSTMAFVRRGLEMKAGRRVELRRISGFDGGGHVVHYQFQLPTA